MAFPVQSTSSQSKCPACGDPAEWLLDGVAYCPDCYNELAYGVIRDQNVHFVGGVAARQDDVSPWQENAIRCLEDRGL